MTQDSVNLVVYLKSLNYIGPFPRGFEVLLVPVKNALDEAKVLYPDLTENTFKSLLKKEKIFIFKTVEDWKELKDRM